MLARDIYETKITDNLPKLIENLPSFLSHLSNINSQDKTQNQLISTMSFDYLGKLIIEYNSDSSLLFFLKEYNTITRNQFSIIHFLKNLGIENLQTLIYSLDKLIEIKPYVDHFDALCETLGINYIQNLILSDERADKLTYFLSVFDSFFSYFVNKLITNILNSHILFEFVTNQDELIDLMKFFLVFKNQIPFFKDESRIRTKTLLEKLDKPYLEKITSKNFVRDLFKLLEKAKDGYDILIFMLDNKLLNEKNLSLIVQFFDSKTPQEWNYFSNFIKEYNNIYIQIIDQIKFELILFRFNNHWVQLTAILEKRTSVFLNFNLGSDNTWESRVESFNHFFDSILQIEPDHLKRVLKILNNINSSQTDSLLNNPIKFIEEINEVPAKRAFLLGFFPPKLNEKATSIHQSLGENKLFDRNVVREIFKFV